MKLLVIGDLHLEDQYQGYLRHQLNTLKLIVERESPKVIVLLGDIFHYRSPSPKVIIDTFNFFSKLALTPGITNIYILRGNHDSVNKSDDCETVLSILDYPGSKVTVVKDLLRIPHLAISLIPHFENSNKIKEYLLNTPECDLVFGHFGYTGCINSTGYFDFDIPLELFKNRTILGHIHSYKEEQNVTILGTPWSTNFGECDYPHYVGLFEFDNGKWSKLKKIEVDFGIRHYACPYESLEAMKDEISNDKYFTILRVLLDKFLDDSTNDIRTKILTNYKVGYVDLKFNPVFDTKLNNRISNYDPQISLTEINSDIINSYLEEQVSTIPIEALRNGLEIIKKYETTED